MQPEREIDGCCRFADAAFSGGDRDHMLDARNALGLGCLDGPGRCCGRGACGASPPSRSAVRVANTPVTPGRARTAFSAASLTFPWPWASGGSIKMENITRPAASTMTSESLPESISFVPWASMATSAIACRTCSRVTATMESPLAFVVCSRLMYRANGPELRLAIASGRRYPELMRILGVVLTFAQVVQPDDRAPRSFAKQGDYDAPAWPRRSECEEAL